MNLERRTQINKVPELGNSLSRGVLQNKCACGQHTHGGGECAACSDEEFNKSMQPKLKIGKANDIYEQQADRLAVQVVRMPTPKNSSRNKYIQKKSLIQRRVSNKKNGICEIPSIVNDVLNSPGQPLDSATRTFMESRFGYEFSRVRIHTDARATESARAIDAVAYTVGRDIAFGKGQYQPETLTGKRILAHELVHVVQQDFRKTGLRAPEKIIISQPREAEEIEAEAFSTRVVDRHQGIQAIGEWLQAQQRSGKPILHRAVAPFGRRRISDDDTSQKARQEIEKAKQLLSQPGLDPRTTERLRASIKGAERALRMYRRTIDSNSSEMHPMVASTTAGNPAGIVIAGLALLATWIFATSPGRNSTNRDAAIALAEALRRLRDAIRVPRPMPLQGPPPVSQPAKPRVAKPPTAQTETQQVPRPVPRPKSRLGPDIAVEPRPRERERRSWFYPLCWPIQLPPPPVSVFVRSTNVERDEETAKQHRMELKWRSFRDPDFDASRFHVHHVVPLFLGGPDDLKINGLLWNRHVHLRGHSSLSHQPQMLNPSPPLTPLPANLYSHPAGTLYELIGFKGRRSETC